MARLPRAVGAGWVAGYALLATAFVVSGCRGGKGEDPPPLSREEWGALRKVFDRNMKAIQTAQTKEDERRAVLRFVEWVDRTSEDLPEPIQYGVSYRHGKTGDAIPVTAPAELLSRLASQGLLVVEVKQGVPDPGNPAAIKDSPCYLWTPKDRENVWLLFRE